MTCRVVAQIAEQSAKRGGIVRAGSRGFDQGAQLLAIGCTITPDVVEQRLILGNQTFPPTFGLVMFEPGESTAAGEIRECPFEFGDVDAAHQAAYVLTLAAFGFVRSDVPVVGKRFSEVRGQWQRSTLFVVQFRKLLAETLQTLCFTFARGLARFLINHRSNVSRIGRA